MDHIRTLLPKVLQKRGIYGQADASLLKHQAMNWLHEKMPGLCESGDIRVQHFKDNVLHIATNHSIAAQECSAVSEALAEYLRKDCGHSRLETIRVGRA